MSLSVTERFAQAVHTVICVHDIQIRCNDERVRRRRVLFPLVCPIVIVIDFFVKETGRSLVRILFFVPRSSSKKDKDIDKADHADKNQERGQQNIPFVLEPAVSCPETPRPDMSFAVSCAALYVTLILSWVRSRHSYTVFCLFSLRRWVPLIPNWWLSRS